jgi:adenylyltransferase/sulfurtransferase
VERNPYLLKCRIGSYELVIFANGRSLIKGTEDPLLAKSLYARYVSC